MIAQPLGAGDTPATVVHVKKDQTLNEAIADVEGAVEVVLPDGVTLYSNPITRTRTTLVRRRLEKTGRTRGLLELVRK